MRNLIYPLFLLLALTIPYYRRWRTEQKRKHWRAEQAARRAEQPDEPEERLSIDPYANGHDSGMEDEL